MMNEYGEMELGKMCLNCGHITEGCIDLLWSPIFEYRDDDVPIIHFMCPKCYHFDCIETITFMIVENGGTFD